MRLQINSISLIGTNRQFSLTPGLNIFTGPIATGKTTLLRCLRGLLGSGLNNFPREARETISNLAGELVINEEVYDIVRPFVTTATAWIDVAGKNETLRMPALRPTSSEEITYKQWLLRKLGLPILDVPRAPTQPDSELSPVSINDYLMYCYLRQDEIDNSVFGHTMYPKNIKRKYVFQIVYGLYPLEISALQEELRETYRKLHRLKNQTEVLEEVLVDTPFANRAELERQVREATTELEQLEDDTSEFSASITEATRTHSLRENLQNLDQAIAELESRLRFEETSLEQMRRLIAQLQTQSNRLTRSIVAGSYLLDFDFILCPRCGSSLDTNRGSDDLCYLCLQQPESQIGRDDLIEEQNRLGQQITETHGLIAMHEESAVRLKRNIQRTSNSRQQLADELDYLTQSYVSDTASAIADHARRRAELQERLKSLSDYLQLHQRRDDTLWRIYELEGRVEELEAKIDAATSSGKSEAEELIGHLEKQFQEILERFAAPRFVDTGHTGIDRKTYLPLLEGRRFDELQSQGFQVIVNVAHALAHQLTAIEFNLLIPNILLIDGLTSNIGHEGLDQARVEAIYDYLIYVAEEYRGKLQIIVADNDVPSQAKTYIRYCFSEDDKLIPEELLQRHGEENE